jgi:hypothetical protein
MMQFYLPAMEMPQKIKLLDFSLEVYVKNVFAFWMLDSSVSN